MDTLMQISIDPAVAGDVLVEPWDYKGLYVRLTAKPNPGYEFYYWVIDGKICMENPIFEQTDRYHEVTAVFRAKGSKMTMAAVSSTAKPTLNMEKFQKCLAVSLNKEKFKALTEIVGDLLEAGYTYFIVDRREDGKLHMFAKTSKTASKRVDLGIFDRVVSDAIHSYDISWNYYPNQLDEGKNIYDYMVGDGGFHANRSLCRFYYRNGWVIRVRTKKGNKHLYAFKKVDGKLAKRNLGLKRKHQTQNQQPYKAK